MPDSGSLTIKLDAQAAQQLSERARQEGVTPEQYAAELVAEAMVDLNDLPPHAPLTISDEELRQSIEKQMRELESGEAQLFSHEGVMAGARAIIEAANARKA